MLLQQKWWCCSSSTHLKNLFPSCLDGNRRIQSFKTENIVFKRFVDPNLHSILELLDSGLKTAAVLFVLKYPSFRTKTLKIVGSNIGPYGQGTDRWTDVNSIELIFSTNML
jgi:hypothetical protein